MSTITKLDPMHRIRRTSRSTSLRALAHAIRMFVGANMTFEAARAAVTLSSLTQIKNDPRLHGDVKQMYFDLATNTGESA